ncbi:hypothetical protein EXIGLDRAFT_831282 [Exidia glandulosa HHB12029]|uniref:F-box domain-containing protein n=1 Tax=Exidia glandulosa HHB12029 TaxID=1314781 RepID=A0A165MTR5_EXIGL|nr:hypothetical protein EXIGLDRAFT_831282 [Exidia glandulosa HHB12029]
MSNLAQGLLATNNVNTPVHTLASELLSAVLISFSTVELSRLLRVCRRWRDVITHDRTLWKVVDLEGRKNFRADALGTILARSGTLEIELRGVRYDSEAARPAPRDTGRRNANVPPPKSPLEQAVAVIASHMARVSVLELSVADTTTLSAFDPVLLRPAPSLRHVSLAYSGGHADMSFRLFQHVTATPNLRHAYFEGFLLPTLYGALRMHQASVFTQLEKLYIKGRASTMPLNLDRLAPRLETLHLSPGEDACNLIVSGRVHLVLHDYTTAEQVQMDLAHIAVQNLRSVYASGIALGPILCGLNRDGDGALTVLDDSSCRLKLTDGSTCTFTSVTREELLTVVTEPARDIFSVVRRVAISAHALHIFPPGIYKHALFTHVKEVMITDLTDTLLLQCSGLLALILTNAAHVVLRASKATELTWETCLRIFSTLGLREKPRFPERLDLYNIELKQPRWVLENGDPDERWFFLRVRMYDAQDNLIRRRSLAG